MAVYNNYFVDFMLFDCIEKLIEVTKNLGVQNRCFSLISMYFINFM